MSRSRTQHSMTHLNIALPHYVDFIQQQMKQMTKLSATSGKTTQQQVRLEQFISRHLAK